MKSSGAPDVGDLVLATALSGLHIFPTPGIILACRGIECLVLWTGSVEQQWWSRSQLKVISESR